MPSKTIVMTDAASGTGKDLAVDLVKTGENVVIVAHDAEHGKALIEDVKSAVPKNK